MDTTNETLLNALQRLEWLLRRHHLRSARDRGPMSSPRRGQGRILSLLKIKNEISQKDLAAILDIRPQSLGELLAKLEKAGFIERTPSESDRRVMEIRLTEAGKAAAEEEPEGDDLGGIFECLEESEREAFATYLERLIARLEEMSGEGFDPGQDEFDRLREFMGGFGRHGGFGHGGPGGQGGPGFGGPGSGRHGNGGGHGGNRCAGYGSQGFGPGMGLRGFMKQRGEWCLR